MLKVRVQNQWLEVAVPRHGKLPTQLLVDAANVDAVQEGWVAAAQDFDYSKRPIRGVVIVVVDMSGSGSGSGCGGGSSNK